jgi:hypothetical protein
MYYIIVLQNKTMENWINENNIKKYWNVKRSKA